MEDQTPPLGGDDGHLQVAAVTVIRRCDVVCHIVGVERAGVALGLHGQVYRSGDSHRRAVCDFPVRTNGQRGVVNILQAKLDLVGFIGGHSHTSIS